MVKKLIWLFLLVLMVSIPLTMCAGSYDNDRYCQDTYGENYRAGPSWKEVTCVQID